MADYNSKTRTNYFSVTDEDQFRKIMAACKGSDQIHACDNEKGGDERKVGFYCDGSILGLPYKLVDDEPVVTFDEDEEEEDLDCDISGDLLFKALQEMLPDGEAIIITTVGSEKMRYLSGGCVVLTKDDEQYVDLSSKAIELARSMLRNPNFTTQDDY